MGKKWFKRGKENGINTLDLHNAVRQGVVFVGSVLEIGRVSYSNRDGKNTHSFAYIGPAEPFIDPDTGAVSHILYNCRPNGEPRIVVVNDIIAWEKVSYLSTRDLRILVRAMCEFERQKKRKRN